MNIDRNDLDASHRQRSVKDAEDTTTKTPNPTRNEQHVDRRPTGRGRGPQEVGRLREQNRSEQQAAHGSFGRDAKTHGTIGKVSKVRRSEIVFSTPEFKEAQRKFQQRFSVNFDRPIEFGMVKKYPWSTPTLQRLEVPVDVDGNPWPLDENGKPILKEGVDMEPSEQFKKMTEGSR